MTEEERRAKEKNEEERKKRIALSVKNSIANSLREFGLGDDEKTS